MASTLGYRHRRPDVVQRGLRALGSSKPGAWTSAKTLVPMDKAAKALSGDRTSAPAILAGLPVLWVTTTGPKSGEP